VAAVIRDHAWQARETYWEEGGLVRIIHDRRQCGFVTVDRSLTSSSFDDDECGHLPSAHQYARGWVPGPVRKKVSRRLLPLPLETEYRGMEHGPEVNLPWCGPPNHGAAKELGILVAQLGKQKKEKAP
jgi:hypothetical protein